ncbi:unnamed protein product [Timema podura]|uniref:Uncharacterized protein n=1 Tax=Timema podura TaxID=61482 RepID=A0ABN7NIZ6_TIMPD|nr:unnamed protein product [Timema podura]
MRAKAQVNEASTDEHAMCCPQLLLRLGPVKCSAVRTAREGKTSDGAGLIPCSIRDVLTKLMIGILQTCQKAVKMFECHVGQVAYKTRTNWSTSLCIRRQSIVEMTLLFYMFRHIYGAIIRTKSKKINISLGQVTSPDDGAIDVPKHVEQ